MLNINVYIRALRQEGVDIRVLSTTEETYELLLEVKARISQMIGKIEGINDEFFRLYEQRSIVKLAICHIEANLPELKNEPIDE